MKLGIKAYPVRLALICALMAAFPGDTLAECERTVRLVTEVLGGDALTTALLNRFALFPGTPIAREPERWGVDVVDPAGDMSQELAFRLRGEDARAEAAIVEALPALRRELYDGLGQPGAHGAPAERLAHAMITGSGHGAILKAARTAAPTNLTRAA